MDDNKLLEALEQMMDRKLEPITKELGEVRADISGTKADIAEMKADIAGVKADIADLKEESKITRHSVNLLLNWADRADRTVVNAGLYTKDED